MRLVVPAAYPWRAKTRAAESRMRSRVSTARAWTGSFLGRKRWAALVTERSRTGGKRVARRRAIPHITGMPVAASADTADTAHTLAAVLAAAWFLTAFALRIGIQVARHGDTGVRLRTEAPLSRAWWARVGFVASTLAVGGAPVAAALGALDGVPALEHGAIAAIGLLSAVAGIGLTL